MTKTEKHDAALYLRLTPSDVGQLDALVARFPIVTKAALARAAMRIGLRAIENDPKVLLSESVPGRGGARPRRTK